MRTIYAWLFAFIELCFPELNAEYFHARNIFPPLLIMHTHENIEKGLIHP